MIRNENVCDQFKYLHEEQVYSGRENKLYWCGRCQIPVYYEKCPVCKQDAVPFVTDLRPVFPEEAVLLEILLKCKGELRGHSLWNAKGNRYFVNGKPLPFVLKDVVTEWDPFEVHRLWRDEILKGEDIGEDEFAERQQKFTVANRERLLKLEEDAFNCVKRAVAKFPERIKMVSFSGGKDSTVVSSVVRRALGTNDILHVFCDTTIEFPFTYEYITVFRRRNRRVPFLKAQYRGYNEHTDKPFLELCRKIGPPSRVMRWCCTTFKTAPISDLIDKFSQEKGVLTFYGVRNSESVRRSKYRDIEHSPKIAKQVVASPIIDWNDLDIWLYLLTRQEEFNYAYRLGFPRLDDYLYDGVFLLVGEDGSVMKDDGTPFLQYVEGKFWVNNHAHVIQGTNDVSTEWLMLHLKSTDISRYVTGAVQPKLSKGNLNSIPFVLPPTEIRKEFNNKIVSFFEQIRSNEKENKYLAETRDYLLPLLLSGEIELTEAQEQVEEVLANA